MRKLSSFVMCLRQKLSISLLKIMTLQFVSTSSELDRFLKAVTELSDVIETVRSGVCGISRGEHALRS